MSFFDAIRDLVSGASEQAGSVAEDVASQILGADQVQEVTDQANQVKDSVLPGDESGDEQ
jgi:hypothetical protein